MRDVAYLTPCAPAWFSYVGKNKAASKMQYNAQSRFGHQVTVSISEILHECVRWWWYHLRPSWLIPGIRLRWVSWNRITSFPRPMHSDLSPLWRPCASSSNFFMLSWRWASWMWPQYVPTFESTAEFTFARVFLSVSTHYCRSPYWRRFAHSLRIL